PACAWSRALYQVTAPSITPCSTTLWWPACPRPGTTSNPSSTCRRSRHECERQETARLKIRGAVRHGGAGTPQGQEGRAHGLHDRRLCGGCGQGGGTHPDAGVAALRD